MLFVMEFSLYILYSIVTIVFIHGQIPSNIYKSKRNQTKSQLRLPILY